MRIVFTHVCVLPQSGLEATDCFVEALLCLVPGRCRSVRAVVVAPSWPSVLAGRLTLDLLEYRSHAAPGWRGGGPCETTRRRDSREGQPGPPRAPRRHPPTSVSCELRAACRFAERISLRQL